MRAPGAETPPPILGEESCSRKVSGDVAGIKSLRIRETSGNEEIPPKVGGGVSAPGARISKPPAKFSSPQSWGRRLSAGGAH